MSRALPDPYPVEAAQAPLRGAVRVPGSKSQTNRALLLSALAGGGFALDEDHAGRRTVVESGGSILAGALRSDDTDRMAAALWQLLPAPASAGSPGCLRGGCTLDCGDGGTPARFLMAAAALADGPVVVDGSPRLRERPMGDGVLLLRQLGVECTWLGEENCLPVRIHARERPTGNVEGGVLRVGRTASSQFVSALLLIAPWLKHGLRVRFEAPPTSVAYLELTLTELERWGVRVQVQRNASGSLHGIDVAPGAPAPRVVQVEPDASSAVYWAAAAALVPGSRLELSGLPMNSVQPDMGAIRALQMMGARLEDGPGGVCVSCAIADPAASADPAHRDRAPAPLRGVQVDAAGFPDGALMVIAAAAAAGSPSRFTGLGTLRVKESDRIGAMADNLRRMGCACETGPDWLDIQPRQASPRGVELPSYNDHRIAMSFAVLGLRTGGVAIADPGCVGKSYPGFWQDLERLTAAPEGSV